MAGWGTRLTALWRGKKPAPVKARKALPAKSKGGQDPRAQLIHDALALHRDHGAPLRAALNKAVKGLEDRRTLRDPEALARLLALAQAQRAMQRLFAGDLRRYLVLAGLRQWTGKEPVPLDKDELRPRQTVTRR
ncbi:MAG: hypothetical protein EPO08_15905 [Rhodospirillaceae bacterium]|nr:MAG: hypothetical protein EPO08_15905 [Rhodospirillaceae bacterium]